MKTVVFIILIAMFFVSCNDNSKLIESNNLLQKELDDCKKTNEELTNTPQNRLMKGQQFFSKNDFNNATKELKEIVSKFSGTEEATKATELLATIDKTIKEQQELEAKKLALGFKAVKTNSSVTAGKVVLKVTSVSSSGSWGFDSYGTEYMSRSAERGEVYIVAKVSISSEVKGPQLPPISVYTLKNGNLKLLGTMGYEFAKWEDYGSYLGNDADFGNDFAHTRTISFSCGLSISKDILDKSPVFVVVKNANCFTRTNNQYGNPPVKYSEGKCGIKSSLGINDFDKEYTCIKIFNSGKI